MPRPWSRRVVREAARPLIPRAGGSLRLSPPVSAAQDAERPLDGLERASVSALAMPWRTGTERHPQERAESEVGPCPLGTHLTPTHPKATSRSTRTAHPGRAGVGGISRSARVVSPEQRRACRGLRNEVKASPGTANSSLGVIPAPGCPSFNLPGLEWRRSRDEATRVQVRGSGEPTGGGRDAEPTTTEEPPALQQRAGGSLSGLPRLDAKPQAETLLVAAGDVETLPYGRGTWCGRPITGRTDGRRRPRLSTDGGRIRQGRTWGT